MSETRPPRKLSPESLARWHELHAAYQFSVAENIALNEHLAANDRAARFATSGKNELAQKERQSAHRWWRSLKFPAGAATRKPGRPSGEHWSAQRRGSLAV